MRQDRRSKQTKVCPPAALPIYGTSTAVTIAKGSVAVSDVHTIAAGGNSLRGGKVYIASSCDNVLLTIGFVVGGDCEPCNDPDAYTIVEQTRFVPNEWDAFEINADYNWAYIKAQTVDASGAATAAMQDVSLMVEWDFAARCPECPEVVVPA